LLSYDRKAMRQVMARAVACMSMFHLFGNSRVSELSLIGVVEVELLFGFGPEGVAPVVTRFSSRSVLGRRMIGSGGRGVSICSRPRKLTLPRSRLLTRSHRPSSPRERFGLPAGADWGIGTRRFRPVPSQGWTRGRPKHALIAPHAVQNHGELAGDRFTGVN